MNETETKIAGFKGFDKNFNTLPRVCRVCWRTEAGHESARNHGWTHDFQLADALDLKLNAAYIAARNSLE